MGDLDICLIKEFARRPGFYDRGDPHFKDKEYVQQSWAEISHQLGYEPNLLKDRMYQLRNRYNLEKRRLENLRMEDPSKPVRSPWPLFYHLTFLDGHIRPRRSYKSMMRRGIDTDRSGNEDDPLAVSDQRHLKARTIQYGIVRGNHHASNGESVDVKYEAEIDSDEDQRTNDNDGSYLDPTNFLADDDSNGDTPTRVQTNNHNDSITKVTQSVGHRGVNGTPQGNGINVRSLESLRRKPSTTSDDFEQPLPKKFMANHQATVQQNGFASAQYGNGGLVNKYAAFGQFLAASLSDMEEKTAFDLIGKFTFEVLKALQEKKSS